MIEELVACGALVTSEALVAKWGIGDDSRSMSGPLGVDVSCLPRACRRGVRLVPASRIARDLQAAEEPFLGANGHQHL